MDNRHSDNCDLVINTRLGLRSPVCTCGAERPAVPFPSVMLNFDDEVNESDLPDYYGGPGWGRSQCHDDFGDQ
jgi:hypothetical protein